MLSMSGNWIVWALSLLAAGAAFLIIHKFVGAVL